MTTEVLTCVYPGCNREVRVVRLGTSLLTLGHRSNPGPKHHRVQLASASRDGQDTRSVEDAVAPAHRGAPDNRRGGEGALGGEDPPRRRTAKGSRSRTSAV